MSPNGRLRFCNYTIGWVQEVFCLNADVLGFDMTRNRLNPDHCLRVYNMNQEGDEDVRSFYCNSHNL